MNYIASDQLTFSPYQESDPLAYVGALSTAAASLRRLLLDVFDDLSAPAPSELSMQAALTSLADEWLASFTALSRAHSANGDSWKLVCQVLLKDLKVC